MSLKIEKEEQKKRELKARKETKNSYNCFGLREYLVLVFALIFFLLPFISIFLLRANGSYNVIAWNEYYGQDGTNFKSNTTGSYFEIDRVYDEYLIPLEDKTYQTIKWGSYHYQFVVNNSDDITFSSQYIFDAKNIFDYFPFIYNLPLGITTISSGGTTSINKINAIIPSNWSNVWNNLGIYFYYVNSKNEGLAFHFGNQETQSNQYELIELATDFGQLKVKSFNINISGELVWNNNSYPSFYYHNSPIDENTYLNDYLSIMYGLFGNVQDDFTTLIESLPFGGGGQIDKTYTLNYDSLLIDISQCRGFPNKDTLPFVSNAMKCGFFINISKNFNIIDYLNYEFDSYLGITIGDQLIKVNNLSPTNVQCLNGITFYDGGLYLGKIISITENLQQVMIYDMIIFFGLIGILVIVALFLEYPKKLTEYQQTQLKQCQYE